MTFLSPYWLFAASAILIPIAIHLWNKRQGRTVKVGSIRWLEASASKQWSRIRLTDFWLLVLRCLILILLAAAVATPVIQRSLTTDEGQKAIYISPELLYSDAIATLKSAIDPLLRRGYQLHFFTPKFSQLSNEKWQQLTVAPLDSTIESGNYWQLLSALADKHTQAQDSVLLFTSDQQRHFPGSPEALQENIQWVPVSLNTSVSWVQAAYLTETDSIKLVIGQSTREGTTFQKHSISLIEEVNNAASLSLRTARQDDSLWVHWGNKIDEKLLVKQQPLSVSMVIDIEQQAERKYIEAAVTAIGNYTGVPIEINKSNYLANSDWLFWLYDKEIPDSVLQLVNQGMQLWVQRGTTPKATTANLITTQEPIRLYKLSQASAAYEHLLWVTSNGEPLLTSQLQGKGMIYHFRSKFSPDWSRLGQSSQLPEILLPILLSEDKTAKSDTRPLPEALLKPDKKTVTVKSVQDKEDHSLIPWFVLLASVLFLLERYITSKRLKLT